ncbi:MAG: HD domain-containing protein, partial [Burkholderiales bacterium]|nr:HD domain-containing protein [Burkholderiales bacterium]
ITKPISPPTLMARVEAYAELAASQRSLRDQNMRLEVRVRERTREIESMQDAMTIAMSSLCETRGNETGNHIRRIRNYVRTLATNLQQRTAFADVLKDEYVHLLYQTAPLYDIGKVGVPDEILLKPQRHTPGEFDVMKLHVDYGLQTLECIELELGTSNAFLETAKEIVACHHERWDGSGYPRGLRGHAIPVSARLMAVADVYDALVSKRVYKSTIPHPEAVKLIEAGGGRQFDPDVVDAFVEVADQFAKIATQYED